MYHMLFIWHRFGEKHAVQVTGTLQLPQLGRVYISRCFGSAAPCPFPQPKSTCMVRHSSFESVVIVWLEGQCGSSNCKLTSRKHRPPSAFPLSPGRSENFSFCPKGRHLASVHWKLTEESAHGKNMWVLVFGASSCTSQQVKDLWRGCKGHDAGRGTRLCPYLGDCEPREACVPPLIPLPGRGGDLAALVYVLHGHHVWVLLRAAPCPWQSVWSAVPVSSLCVACVCVFLGLVLSFTTRWTANRKEAATSPSLSKVTQTL